jgi:hypothetical protein
MPQSLNFIEMLHRALEAPIGVVYRTNSVERLMAKIYEARRASPLPEFDGLSLQPSRSSPTTELWIVKKVPQLPQDRSNAA